jgi:molybdopterin molybdotransferase
MNGFDTIVMVDWSAGKRAATPRADAIWIGVTRDGEAETPQFCPGRHEAEAQIARLIEAELALSRRVLIGFDFPFGYPAGFARKVTGQDDPFALWDWLEARIVDAPDGSNNRFDIAEQMNALFDGAGPFWGKPSQATWPGVPYRKQGIDYNPIAEKRACDVAAKAASSCFQLYFPPTVGSQILMGLPVLARLRRRFADTLACWPFEAWDQAPIVIAEIWPGLVQGAVDHAMAQLDDSAIKDCEQVRLLSLALARQSNAQLAAMMDDPTEPARREEAWILGAGHRATLEAAALNIPEQLKPPPLKNDCFALPPGIEWTPVEDALSLLRNRLRSVVPCEVVPVMHAAGRVLAKDLTARRANPPLPNTAVDGYGFAAKDVADRAEIVLPLVDGRAAAGGRFVGHVPAGHAIRVLTGAALPSGVDTVVLEEDCVIGSGQVAFRGPVKPGSNTRRSGEDVVEGAPILHAGRVLTPADLALAAAVGCAEFPVHVPLRVGVLSTGDEVVDPGGTAGPGQIFDANRPMLLSLTARFGHHPVDLGHVRDDRAALRARLDTADVDAILTSGGASAGDEDHVSALLRESGALTAWRIALKPGRPLALGLWNGVPVFGLPGNPVAAFVCTLVFARPAMQLLAGADWAEPDGFEVPANFTKKKKAGRREYLRARLRNGRVDVFKSEGSGRISGLSWAEGLVELPDTALQITPGDPVRYIPFGSYGI